MKKLLFFFAFTALYLASSAQTRGTLPYDSVVLEKKGGNAELIIKSSTRDSIGFLLNIGGGRTHFVRALRKVNDSTYLVGTDTLHLPTGGSGGVDASKEPLITPSNLAKQYWNGWKQFVYLNTDSVSEGAINLFFTAARARKSVSLTHTGTSGPATYDSLTGILNIPNYTGGSGGDSSIFASLYYMMHYVDSSFTVKYVHINDGLHTNAAGDSVGLGGKPFLEDIHLDGSDSHDLYIDSADIFPNGKGFRSIGNADTSKKMVVFDPSTHKLSAMYYPHGDRPYLMNNANYTLADTVDDVIYQSTGTAYTLTIPAYTTNEKKVLTVYNGSSLASLTVSQSIENGGAGFVTTISAHTGYKLIWDPVNFRIRGIPFAASEYFDNHIWLQANNIQTPTTGAFIGLTWQSNNIINPAGTLATLNITPPASPSDKETVLVTFKKAITSITWSTAGGISVAGHASAAADTQFYLTFDSSTSTWY